MANASLAINEDDIIILTPEVIVQTMGMLFGSLIKVSVDDIKKPQSQKIESIYRHFVNNILLTNQEEMAQARASCLNTISYPELHEASVPLINFLIDFNQVIQMASCTVEVTLRDIVAPSPKRTVKILSWLINFSNFKNSKQDTVENIVSEVKSKEIEARELIERNDYLRQKTAEARDKKNDEKEELENLKEKYDSLRSKIAVIKAKQGQKQSFLSALKTAHKEGYYRKGFINTAQEIQPLKVKKHNNAENFQNYSSQIALLNRCKRDVEFGFELIKVIEGKLNKATQSSDKVQSYSVKLNEERQMIADMRRSLQNMKQQINNKHSKVSKHSNKMQAEIESARKEAELKMKRGQADTEKMIEKIVDEIEEIKENDNNAKIKESISKAEDEIVMGRLTSKHEELIIKLDEYHSNLIRQWEEVRPFIIDERKFPPEMPPRQVLAVLNEKKYNK